MDPNDTSGDLILEDINTGKKFFLRQNDRMYRCGRDRRSKILVKSLFASRNHCTFWRIGSQLYVVDNASTNGIAQPQRVLIRLRISDSINVGGPIVKCERRRLGQLPAIFVLKKSSQPKRLPHPGTAMKGSMRRAESMTTTENEIDNGKSLLQVNPLGSLLDIDKLDLNSSDQGIQIKNEPDGAKEIEATANPVNRTIKNEVNDVTPSLSDLS